jgi:hypothetical protein
MRRIILPVFLAVAAGQASGETVINGSRRILGAWDASMAARTLAARQAAADPATCVEGEIYYNTSTHMHRQCSAADTWSDLAPSLPPGTAGQVYMSDGTTVRAITPGAKITGNGSQLKFAETDLSAMDLRDDFLPRFGVAGTLGWMPTLSGTTVTGVSAGEVADPQYGSRCRVATKSNPAELDQGGLYLGPLRNLGSSGSFASWDARALVWNDTGGTLPGPPADYAFQFGFNTSSVTASDGMMVIYDPAGMLHGCPASTNWQFWVRIVGGTIQCVDSGIPVEPRTKYRLRLWSPQPGTVYMSVNDTVSPAFTQSLPDAAGQRVWINCMTLQAGAQKSFDVARFALHIDGLPE